MKINNISIKEFRKDNGLTQKELAVLTGLTYRTIQSYESGGVIPLSKHALFRTVFNTFEPTTVNEKQPTYNSSKEITYDVIEDLRNEIYTLQGRIKDKDEIISLLKEKLKTQQL